MFGKTTSASEQQELIRQENRGIMQAEESKYLKVERARTEISPDGTTVPMGSLLLEAVVELPN